MGQNSAGTLEAPKDVFKTGSIYSGGDSLTVSGTINGRACEITVDTGSNISIVRPDVLIGMNQNLIEPSSSCLRIVTGERAPIHGKGWLQLGIGSMEVPQELWVADMHDQCILSLDFLQSHGCQVNLKDGALIIGEEKNPLKKPPAMHEPTCSRAVLMEGVCLPPLSEVVVPVRMDRTEVDCRWGLLEQTTAPISLDGVMIARTLVDLRREQLPLRVMNLSYQPQIINKGTELACCSTITSVVTPKADTDREISG